MQSSTSQFAGNVALVTMGCSKNLVDSEVMLGSLIKRGFQPVGDPANAEVIVVNTCGFLTAAVEEGIQKILDLSEHKRTGRCRKLIVAGCMVERYRNKLQAEFPEVDRFLSTDELLKVADDIDTTDDCLDEARRPYFLYDETMPRARANQSYSSYVKISEGCDRPCSFCIIPKIRGGFRSRPIESVIAEVRALVDDGVSEINFVAQDLTAYGTDFNGNRGIKSALPELLDALDAFETRRPEWWMRLFYAYPIGTDEALVRQIVDSPRICNYLDMPLQHISGSVLKAMRRPLGERGTRSLIEKIRSVAPEIALRTTFITGFPGETEEDVRALEEFVREGHFQHVGVFTYSQESEAASYAFDEQVDEEEKEQRRARIMEAQQAVVESNLAGYVGTQQRVLLQGEHAESEHFLSARTDWQGPEEDGEVIINDRQVEAPAPGNFATVEVTEIAGYDLVGTLVGESG